MSFDWATLLVATHPLISVFWWAQRPKYGRRYLNMHSFSFTWQFGRGPRPIGLQAARQHLVQGCASWLINNEIIDCIPESAELLFIATRPGKPSMVTRRHPQECINSMQIKQGIMDESNHHIGSRIYIVEPTKVRGRLPYVCNKRVTCTYNTTLHDMCNRHTNMYMCL